MIRVEFAHAHRAFTEKPDHAKWRLLGIFSETGDVSLPPDLKGQRVWFRSRWQEPASAPYTYSKSFVVPK
jgi:hypothetical protein